VEEEENEEEGEPGGGRDWGLGSCQWERRMLTSVGSMGAEDGVLYLGDLWICIDKERRIRNGIAEVSGRLRKMRPTRTKKSVDADGLGRNLLILDLGTGIFMCFSGRPSLLEPCSPVAIFVVSSLSPRGELIDRLSETGMCVCLCCLDDGD
jgi:hypothetical protein